MLIALIQIFSGAELDEAELECLAALQDSVDPAGLIWPHDQP